MRIIDRVAAGDGYTDAATIAYVYRSNGGYFTVEDHDAYVKVAYDVQGHETWTQEFHVPPGNGILPQNVIGIAFRNYAAGNVAHVSAALSTHAEPPIALTSAGLVPAGGGKVVTTDGVTTVDPTDELFIGTGITLTNPAPNVAELTTTPVTHNIVACWGGVSPIVVGPGTTWIVPDLSGASHTFSLATAKARVESTQLAACTFVVEKSAAGGAFSPTTVTTLTIGAGSYEASNSGIGVNVTTGDLLRINFTIPPLVQCLFTVEIEGS